MTGYDDAYACENWYKHEDKVFIPTELLTGASTIKNLCCKCVDALIHDKKLVIYE